MKKKNSPSIWIILSIVYIIFIFSLIKEIKPRQVDDAKFLTQMNYCALVGQEKVFLSPLEMVDCSMIGINFFNDCLVWITAIDGQRCLETYLVSYPSDSELWKSNILNVGIDGRPINIPERFRDCWLVHVKDDIRYWGCDLK